MVGQKVAGKLKLLEIEKPFFPFPGHFFVINFLFVVVVFDAIIVVAATAVCWRYYFFKKSHSFGCCLQLLFFLLLMACCCCTFSVALVAIFLLLPLFQVLLLQEIL